MKKTVYFAYDWEIYKLLTSQNGVERLFVWGDGIWWFIGEPKKQFVLSHCRDRFENLRDILSRVSILPKKIDYLLSIEVKK